METDKLINFIFTNDEIKQLTDLYLECKQDYINDLYDENVLFSIDNTQKFVELLIFKFLVDKDFFICNSLINAIFQTIDKHLSTN